MILGITLAVFVILVTIIPISVVLSRKARAKEAFPTYSTAVVQTTTTTTSIATETSPVTTSASQIIDGMTKQI